MKRILALDYGEKRIGVAISDEEKSIALGRPTISYHSQQEAIQEILKIAIETPLETLVIGLPYSLSGQEGPKAQETRQFSSILSQAVNVPIVFEDERMTSKLSDRLLTSSDRDQKSAILILQAYLDRTHTK